MLSVDEAGLGHELKRKHIFLFSFLWFDFFIICRQCVGHGVASATSVISESAAP